jgi:negative regulator of flagellin synthesis FlgM
MKIENGTVGSVVQLDTQTKKKAAQAGAEAAQPAKPSGEAFSVDISAKAEQLNRPQDQDEISRERVAAIRDQLAAGTYNISGKDVANKILGVLKK